VNHNLNRFDLVRTEMNLAIDRANGRHRFESQPRRWRPHRQTDR
jgi:hypothetical protein